MLCASVSTFNEEAGELSFSMLARSVLGDTTKNKLDHLSRLYTLLHVYGDVEQSFRHDGFRKDGAKNWRKLVPKEGEAAMSVAAFMNGVLRQISRSSFLVYNGSVRSYANRTHALANLVQIKSHPPLWVADVLPLLDTHVDRAKQLFISDWAADFATVWPECAHREDPDVPSYSVRRQPMSDDDHISDQFEPSSEEDLQVHEPNQLVSKPQRPKRKKAPSCESEDNNSATSGEDNDLDSDVSTRLASSDEDDDDELPDPHRKRWANIDKQNILTRRTRERVARQARRRSDDIDQHDN